MSLYLSSDRFQGVNHVVSVFNLNSLANRTEISACILARWWSALHRWIQRKWFSSTVVYKPLCRTWRCSPTALWPLLRRSVAAPPPACSPSSSGTPLVSAAWCAAEECGRPGSVWLWPCWWGCMPDMPTPPACWQGLETLQLVKVTAVMFPLSGCWAVCWAGAPAGQRGVRQPASTAKDSSYVSDWGKHLEGAPLCGCRGQDYYELRALHWAPRSWCEGTKLPLVNIPLVWLWTERVPPLQVLLLLRSDCRRQAGAERLQGSGGGTVCVVRHKRSRTWR